MIVQNAMLSLSNKKTHQRGFTLLELLVVIGIIAILALIGISSYSAAQKKSRDAKRKTDLRSIQTALEQYYSICGFKYPTPVGTSTNKYFTSIYCPSPTQGIMPTVPKDPDNNNYICTGCNSSQYTICATLEVSSDDFCVQNQQ